MKIKCIIVDDEPASREILETYIAECPDLNLIMVCKNAFEANDITNKQNIHLIFLDINMPRLSGMSFYKSLSNPPYVIFTTAYPEFAVEGFEVNAIDYLLKPFPFERFLKAKNKAIEVINRNLDWVSKEYSSENDFLLLRSDKKIHRVQIQDITYLEAIGDYVKVHFAMKSIVVHDTFQNLLSQLPENRFIRVHKSYAISIEKFELIEGNTIKIREHTIPIGQAFRAVFMDRIKNRGKG
jgi:DNA-binding LytR/AlgR family response regulator